LISPRTLEIKLVLKLIMRIENGGRLGRDRMVVGFTILFYVKIFNGTKKYCPWKMCNIHRLLKMYGFILEENEYSTTNLTILNSKSSTRTEAACIFSHTHFAWGEHWMTANIHTYLSNIKPYIFSNRCILHIFHGQYFFVPLKILT
jgi:hypothetical protein